MLQHVHSADGTRIAYERLGRGPAIILIGGMFCQRDAFGDLAESLAPRGFNVVTYGRRGRGGSSDSEPYAVAREIEDLEAIVAAVGGSAAVYGHSSGAGLALNAAAAGLPVTRLVLHEPPYGGDDTESKHSAQDLAERVRAAIAAGDRRRAIRAFFSAMGLPHDLVEQQCADERKLAVAHTMLYDFDVMGEFTGGGIPRRLVASIRIPTLVLVGGASLPFFRDTAERLSDLLRQGQLVVLDGVDHEASGAVVAPAVARFLGAVP